MGTVDMSILFLAVTNIFTLLLCVYLSNNLNKKKKHDIKSKDEMVRYMDLIGGLQAFSVVKTKGSGDVIYVFSFTDLASLDAWRTYAPMTIDNCKVVGISGPFDSTSVIHSAECMAKIDIRDPVKIDTRDPVTT